MAKAKSTGAVNSFQKKPKVRRKGVHAKTKTTKNKRGSNYVKPYAGQGK